MNNEEKPKTIEELFVSEYYKLKAQLEQESFDSKYWENHYNELLENYGEFRRAFKALGTIMNGDGTVTIRNCFVYKDDEGYDELRNIVEQLADDEDDGR